MMSRGLQRERRQQWKAGRDRAGQALDRREEVDDVSLWLKADASEGR